MVELDAERLRNVTAARQQWAELLDDAQQGETTHVLRGSRVVAHLIPPNTLVVQDERVLQTMVAAAAQLAVEAKFSADPTPSSTPQEVTDFAMVLRWLKSNPIAHHDALSLYVAALIIHLEATEQDLSVQTVINSLGGAESRGDDLPRREVELALKAAPEVVQTARRADRDPNVFSPLNVPRTDSHKQR